MIIITNFIGNCLILHRDLLRLWNWS